MRVCVRACLEISGQESSSLVGLAFFYFFLFSLASFAVFLFLLNPFLLISKILSSLSLSPHILSLFPGHKTLASVLTREIKSGFFSQQQNFFMVSSEMTDGRFGLLAFLSFPSTQNGIARFDLNVSCNCCRANISTETSSGQVSYCMSSRCNLAFLLFCCPQPFSFPRRRKRQAIPPGKNS